MARAERLLRLMQLLRRYRQPVSAAKLAEQLEVSARSIYRDIELLRRQGATIDGEAGLGYVLRPGYLLPPLMFTDEELEAIVLGLRLTAEHGDLALGAAAGEVMSKLRAVLPRDLRQLLEATALLAGPGAKRAPEAIDLSLVRRVIREGRKAELHYRNAEGVATRRVIWPIGLAFFERVRIVIAWCETRAAFRAFRADRVVQFTALEQKSPRSRVELLREWRLQEGVPAQLPD